MSNNSSPFHSVPMLLVCTAIVTAMGLKIPWVFEVAGWPGALAVVGLLANHGSLGTWATWLLRQRAAGRLIPLPQCPFVFPC